MMETAQAGELMPSDLTAVIVSLFKQYFFFLIHFKSSFPFPEIWIQWDLFPEEKMKTQTKCET